MGTIKVCVARRALGLTTVQDRGSLLEELNADCLSIGVDLPSSWTGTNVGGEGYRTTGKAANSSTAIWVAGRN